MENLKPLTSPLTPFDVTWYSTACMHLIFLNNPSIIAVPDVQIMSLNKSDTKWTFHAPKFRRVLNKSWTLYTSTFGAFGELCAPSSWASLLLSLVGTLDALWQLFMNVAYFHKQSASHRCPAYQYWRSCCAERMHVDRYLSLPQRRDLEWSLCSQLNDKRVEFRTYLWLCIERVE